ncbi:Rieske (2Fe-2S) protein [Mycetohabitans rhizoxinica]|uniref:Rieske (2Fe-2S) protein n=1 Tax=Mycetohabitans rhizoxinica TaxID=412963 RepID=UPI0030D36247
MQPVRICASDELVERGRGIRCAALAGSVPATVFFVRYHGVVYGYLNRCAHVPMELDWSEGEFFERSRLYLMCATHGAIYAPDTGRCVGGPCRGGRLRPLQVQERDTADGPAVFWLPDNELRPLSLEAGPDCA